MRYQSFARADFLLGIAEAEIVPKGCWWETRLKQTTFERLEFDVAEIRHFAI